MLTISLIAIIFLAAGFTQGMSGFGSALVAVPLLAMVIDVKIAVPLCALNGLLITLYLSIHLRRHIDWRSVLPLTLGCIPGIYVGVAVLKNTDDDIIKIALGTMLISYALYCLSRTPKEKKIGSGWAYIAGFATGAIGAAFSAGGPPTIIYTTLTGWTKDKIKATLSGFFLITGSLIASAHALTGLTSEIVLEYFAASALFVCTGVYAGSVCCKRFDRKTYLKLIHFLLLIMGLMLAGSGM